MDKKKLVVALALGAAVGAAQFACGKPPPEKVDPFLVIRVEPSTIPTDGTEAVISLTGWGRDGADLEGTATVRVTCGTVDGVDATHGVPVQVSKNIGLAKYSCDASKFPCCETWGPVDLAATMAGGLASKTSATIGAGGVVGGGGGGGGGGSSSFAADSNKVILYGDLIAGPCGTQAVAQIESPGQPTIAFPCTANLETGKISHKGDLYYMQGGVSIRRWVPDKLVWDSYRKAWSIPSGPDANDLIVATPGCVDPAAPRRFVLQQGGDGVAYACYNNSNEPTWFDVTGSQVAPAPDELLAWRADGLKLVYARTVTSVTLAVIDNAGNKYNVAGVSRAALVRGHAGGFWVAAPNAAQELERWYIDSAGVASLEGKYVPASPDSVQREPEAMDAQGDIFSVGHKGVDAFIVKRGLLPGVAAVVLKQDTSFVQDWASTPPKLRILMAQISYHGLITGP